MSTFALVAQDVYVLRHPVLDVNVTLVVGDGEALLVDTLSTGAQARALVVAARAITPHPWTVVNTHHHFDHCFGNAVVAGDRPVWAHEEAARRLAARAEPLRRAAYEQYGHTDPTLGEELLAVQVRVPDRRVHRHAELTIGGRRVHLRHLGRGHTDGDLLVEVPDADLVVAGDLVEESGPPDFEEAFPLDWPETVAALLARLGPQTAVVPGHGAPVGPAFVAEQHAKLAEVAWQLREAHADGAPVERLAQRIAERTGWPAPSTLAAARRGYAALSGVA